MIDGGSCSKSQIDSKTTFKKATIDPSKSHRNVIKGAKGKTSSNVAMKNFPNPQKTSIHKNTKSKGASRNDVNHKTRYAFKYAKKNV